MNLSEILFVLTTYFSSDELRTLCLHLSVDYDNLGGEAKEGKARELIFFMQRNGRLPDLVQQIQALRANLIIPSSPPDPPSTPDLPPPSPSPPKILKDILEKLTQRRLALFIGADLPAAITGVPGRQILADELARQEGIEPGQWLTAVAQQVMQSGNRFHFTDFLRRQLDTTHKTPQPFHQHLVTLTQKYRLNTLITTAYDDLLEIAFRHDQVSLNRVITDSDLRFTNEAYPTLIKLYGDWQRIDSLTVTQQDVNALLRGREKPEMVAEIRRVFRQDSILFIGHDLHDPFVESLFDEVTGGTFQASAFAVWPDISAREAAAFKSNRGLTVIETEPLAFVTQLLSSAAILNLKVAQPYQEGHPPQGIGS